MKILGIQIEYKYAQENIIIACEKGQHREINEWLNKNISCYGDKDYDVIIKPKKQKKSTNANRYLWTLINQIAQVKGIREIDVYKNEIRDGTEYNMLCMSEEAVQEFSRNWSMHGTGWIVTYDGPYKNEYGETIKGLNQYRAYYGTSVYDSKQMAAIIDRTVQDAKTLGIDTWTPDKIERVKKMWGDSNGRMG